MSHAWKIFRAFLFVWGAVTFAVLLLIVGWNLFQFGTATRPTNKTASKNDVRFVLKFCNLGDERIEEVVHSYASSRSSSGSHLDGHAIRVSHLDPSEFVLDEGRGIGGWYQGDALDGPAKPAIDFVTYVLGSSEIQWFPTIDEIRSSKTLVFVWSVDIVGTRPIAAEVILARPDDKMVYYFSSRR